MTIQAGQQNSTADEPYVGRRVHDYSGGLANTIAYKGDNSDPRNNNLP